MMPAPLEIERKFLVCGEGWRAAITDKVRLRQGYLSDAGSLSTRIRLSGSRGWLTLKSREAGPARVEFEYEIPAGHAERLLHDFCRAPLIEKVRYTVAACGQSWSVDVFEGHLAGLVLAEIELPSAQAPATRPIAMKR